jgi:hypothetical protein
VLGVEVIGGAHKIVVENLGERPHCRRWKDNMVMHV